MTALSILELVRVTENTDARGALDNARNARRDLNLSDGAQSGPVPERPQRGQFRRDLWNRRAMSCGACQMALAKRVRMSWVQWRRSLRRHARRAAFIPV